MGQEIAKTDLAELRRLWEKTTPGEWALVWEDGKTGVLASMIGKLVAFIGNPDPSDGYEPTRKANGEFIAAAHNALPALLDELEAAPLEMRRQGSVIAELREEVRRLTQANGDIRKERDRAVKEAQRQDGVAKGLRRELREELNRWVSVIRAIDPEALCDFYDEHGSQEYLKAWLDARDRRQKLIGAAEELERIAANWYQEMVAWTATDFEERAAKLRQEAEGK